MIFRIISNVEYIRMMNSIEVFLGFEGVRIFGGLEERGVFEWVEDVVCIFVVIVCRVVFGIVWER